MKTEAMVIRGHGDPSVLERTEIELGDLAPTEVRVRVRAVALNRLDLWVRGGLPALRCDFPHRLGSDIAGEIEAVGSAVRGVEIGARVLVNPGVSCGACERCLRGEDNLCPRYRILGESTHGGYARQIHVPAVNIVPMPERLDFVHAAAVPLVFLTAWQMVMVRGKVSAGDVVLIQAAGSGVSSAAIQIAKLAGARVITTASTEAKLARARELGADVAIDYTNEDFVKVCRQETSKRGVDVALDHVGGEVFERTLAATAWGGRIVTCGATAGHQPKIDLRHVFFRQLQILGSTMGSKASLFRIARLVQEAKLHPVVDRAMPLWEAAEAHRILERREAFGKVVLTVDAAQN